MAFQFFLSAAILAGTWFALRRQAGGGSSLALMPLDVAPIVLGWLVLLSVDGRPVMSAVAVAAGGAGLVLADAAKRATLMEPLVFADRAELLEVVRHPRLYLPFAGPALVVGGAAGAVLALTALMWLEPRAPHPPAVGMAVLAALLVVLPTRGLLLGRVAGWYRARGLSGDPVADMRRFGFLASLIMQATVARQERPGRRGAVAQFAAAPGRGPGGPVVMVQVESFFDARRLGRCVPGDLLPEFDRLRRGAVMAGRLEVPCWGANTVRSEFAALTGIGQEALGLDRFNPYERFAQHRLRSVAWEMKQAGYRTVCVHPFDRRFYARHRVMRHLGFDEFLGEEAFVDAPRAGGFVTDAAVAEAIAAIVRERGARVFVFAMTMANHGPWDGVSASADLPSLCGPPAGLPEAGALRRFLAGLRGSDAMMGMLMDAMPPDGMLAVYGDHQPSLPAAFAALGLADGRTDYAIWRPGQPAGPERDLRAEDLACAILASGRGGVDTVRPDLPYGRA